MSEANRQNDLGILEEISSLLLEIKSAWDAMPDEVKRPGGVQGGQVSAAR